MAANPGVNGLVFELPRVLDAVVDDRQLDDYILAYDNVLPVGLVAPFTFSGCRAVEQEPVLSNITYITNPDDDDTLIVDMDVTITIRIALRDSLNVSGTADATVTIHETFIIDRPCESKFPFGFSGMVAAQCATGIFAADGTLTVQLCVMIVIKVIVDVLVRIPIIRIEPPRSMEPINSCENFFALPLYPEVCLL